MWPNTTLEFAIFIGSFSDRQISRNTFGNWHYFILIFENLKMKRSKFLKSSKEMLSRSFDSTKCKTSLRLAGSRLKLLRNKKDVQMNQMKREIAQLLESGQDHTARIRVEHVIREEKMITAYELVEIYCELIVARLSMIESQKTCPIDLKEAIASVLFASPRCGDVSELVDVKKHFTAKYGKGFTAAAVELHPDCGVSRMLIEKLSVVAPDEQTKLKVLGAIAEEHNVTWDPKSFDEKDSVPTSEWLTGPSTSSKESEPHVEPPRFTTPDVQAPQSNNMMHSPPLIFSQMDNRTSLGTENLASTQASGVSPTFQQEARTDPPASGKERDQLFRDGNSTPPLDAQMWNMEFKDAASAGKAAAEFADRAILAFKAAAELSGHESDNDDLNDELPETKGISKLANAQLFSEESMSKSLSDRTRLEEEQLGKEKANNLKTERTLEDDESLNDVAQDVSGYSQKSSLKEGPRDEMNTKHMAETDDNFRQENIQKQAGIESTDAYYSGISDNVNIFSHSEEQNTGSEKQGNLAFDESDSDSCVYQFDMASTDNDHYPGFHFPSSDLRSRKDQHKTDSWSHPSGIENPFFTRKNSSEKLTSMDDGPKAVTFDESDGSASDLEFSAENSVMKLNHSPERESGDQGQNFGKLKGGDLSHNDYNILHYSMKKIDEESKDNSRIDSDISEEEEFLNRITRVQGGISRRTKPVPSTSGKESYSNFDDDMDRKSRPTTNYWGPPEDYERECGDQGPNFGKLKGGGLSRNDYNILPYLKKKIDEESKDNSRIDSDSCEEEEFLNRISCVQSGISRRTKPAPSASGEDSYSNFDGVMERKLRPTKSNYWGPPENYDSVKAIFETTEEPKIRLKSEDSGASRKDDNEQKPSHVHPKLPDYDTLFQSFRNDRS